MTCSVSTFGIGCCLPSGHPGFHKSANAMALEATLTPEQCEELEIERWEMRRVADEEWRRKQ